MSIFGKIKDAIFGKAKPASVPPAANAKPASTGGAQGGPAIPLGTQPQPEAVDVDAILADLAAQKGGEFNYKTSIVDLMKLLDLDSSLDNRKELAEELGYTGARDGSAEMNIWLHKQVMRELEQHGGKVSAELRD